MLLGRVDRLHDEGMIGEEGRNDLVSEANGDSPDPHHVDGPAGSPMTPRHNGEGRRNRRESVREGG